MAVYLITPATGAPYAVDMAAEPDGLPDGFTWTALDAGEADALALSGARYDKRAAVKLRRDAAETGGCDVAGIGRFQTDPDSRGKVNGAAVMAMLAGEAFSIDWRLADDSIVTLSAAQMIAAGLAIGAHVAACQYRKNQLDALIDAAGSAAEVHAINIGEGWP